MPTVIRIRSAKGGKVSLTLDDGTFLRVDAALVLQLGLKEGTELTGEEMEFLRPQNQTDPEKAKEAAARILSRRPLSEAELMGKLLEKGFSEETASQAVSFMKELGFVNDAAYASAWVQEFYRRGLSARAMAAKLREKGLAKDVIEEALADLPPPDEILDAFVSAKANGKPLDRALRQKIYAYLYGKGFDSADIQSALYRYGQTAADDADDAGFDF